ncbi:hypothetical protein ACUNV4_30150 [Granulosicoccus sp. 3-233]|uniref:hypothetical protein n=1 Tax=Granulosicoccus sp. 3-233 TaxID=3417969 RepID=UPI003D3565E5
MAEEDYIDFGIINGPTSNSVSVNAVEPVGRVNLAGSPIITGTTLIAPNQVSLGENFNINVTLAEYQGAPKELLGLRVVIDPPNGGETIEPLELVSGPISFTANQSVSRSFTTSIFEQNGPGTYGIRVQGLFSTLEGFIDLGFVEGATGNNPIFITAIQTVEPVGWIDLATGLTISPRNIATPSTQVLLDKFFDVNISLKEYLGAPKAILGARIVIEPPSGAPVITPPELTIGPTVFSANQQIDRTLTTRIFSEHGPGVYKLRAQGLFNLSEGYIDFDIVPEGTGANPLTITATGQTNSYSSITKQENNAIFITHGWKSSSDAWPSEMGSSICNRLGISMSEIDVNANDFTFICSGNQWDVWVIDWSSVASQSPPSTAFNGASTIAESIARRLYPMEYDHIHFVAHSAGSNLISSFATLFRTGAENSSSIKKPFIHLTFLDAYDPNTIDLDNTTQDYSQLGQDADAVDNYIDSRFLGGNLFGLDRTQNIVAGATNFEIKNAEIRVPTTLELLSGDAQWRHAWPYVFYNNSIRNAGYQVGFQLSLESGRLATVLDRTTKYCIINNVTDGCSAESVGTFPVTAEIDNIYIGEVERLATLEFDSSDVSNPEDGYVFSRTDVEELRWIATNNNGVVGSIWIDQLCAESLGGPTVFGNWGELTDRAPAQDSINDPCTTMGSDPVVNPTGYVFSRTDVEELRWIATNNNGVVGSIWIDQLCAESLGGPTVFGNWGELTARAPAQDTIDSPCTTMGTDPVVNPTGYVFSRTDVEELRWIATNNEGVTGSIWIGQMCAESLGGPTVFGDWGELTARAPAQDTIDSPCTTMGSDPVVNPTGYVFSRTDVEELRWIATNSDGVVGSIWIDQLCAESLGGSTVFGDWGELTARAPAQDSIDSPCR